MADLIAQPNLKFVPALSPLSAPAGRRDEAGRLVVSLARVACFTLSTPAVVCLAIPGAYV